MAASWHLAPALVELRTELNQRWPARSTASDGSIGDADHSARTSDHNPNTRGSVNAIDVTASGIDAMSVISKLCADYRTNYVIYRRTIWSRSANFRPRPYYGANPHNIHIHVSILQTKRAEQSRSAWGIAAHPGLPSTGAPGPAPVPPPLKETTLSAAEIQELKVYIDQRVNDLATNLGGRKKLDQQAITTWGLIADKGLSRQVMELLGEAAGRHAFNRVKGEIEANRLLLNEIKAAGGGAITDDMLAQVESVARDATYEGAKAGFQAGSEALAAQLEAAVREVITDVVFDLGRELDADAVADITKGVVTEITNRLSVVDEVAA